jgi:predicted ferric reductase
MRFYESFLILHIVFVILSLVGCWYHLVPHFNFDYGYQVWLYICFAFWSADRLTRLARVAYYNRLGGSKALVEAIPGCDIMRVTIFPRTVRGFGPSQHSFLYLGGLGKFWESHPFSVASWKTGLEQPLPTGTASASPSDSDKKGVNVEQSQCNAQNGASICFLIRAHSGMTSRLRRHLSSSPSSSIGELSVYTEGPYAGHQATLYPLLAADAILCIAGGIGITHVLGFLQEFYTSTKLQVGETQGKGRGVIKSKRLILAWSAKEMPLIEYVKWNFLADVEEAEYFFWCTGSSQLSAKLDSRNVRDESRNPDNLRREVTAAVVKAGRMNIESVLRASVEPSRQTTVLVCAPGAMADEVTKQVVSCAQNGFKVDLVEEAFAW